MPIPLEGLYLSKPLVPGKIPTNNPFTNIRTFCAGEAVKFGRAVQISSDDPAIAINMQSSSATMIGVAVVSPVVHQADRTAPAYASGNVMGVCDQGPIMVFVEESVNIGDAVRVRITADTGKYAGSFGKTVDGGKTILLDSTCAQWRSKAASGLTGSELTAELFLSPPFKYTAD